MQISTDEVYGSVPEGSSKETDELRPRNPYSASKAGADRLAYSYWATYDVPVVITPRLEQLRPEPVSREGDPALHHQRDGRTSRCRSTATARTCATGCTSSDHCRALDLIIEHGAPGEVYNIGGGNHVKNVDLTHRILELLGKPESLIRHVADRPGHDRRYSLDTTKLQSLGWTPRVAFEQGLAETVAWYTQNEWWWRPIKEQDPAFRAYYQTQYRQPAGLSPRWLAFPSSPAPPASRAATSSTVCCAITPRWRRGPIPAARRRPTATPRCAGRRSICSIATPWPRRSLRCVRPSSITAPAPRTSATRGRIRCGRCASMRSAPTTCSTPSASRDCNAPCWCPDPRSSTGRRSRRSTKTRRSARRIPTA